MHPERAIDLLKSATVLYPQSSQAWISLARTYQTLNDWENAFEAWRTILKLSLDKDVRPLAEASILACNDERIIAKLILAEKQAAQGSFEEAIGNLVKLTNLKPSPRILGRVRERYYQYLVSEVTTKLSNTSVSEGWKSIAITTFGSETESDRFSLRDRLCHTFANKGGIKTKVLSLSQNGLSLLQKGKFSALSDADSAVLTKANVDAVVFGVFGDKLSIYVLDTKSKETSPVTIARRMGYVPGLPNCRETWALLPKKLSSNHNLRVELWTEKVKYAIGDKLSFHVRSNKECYLTLIDLQTSGGLYILYPNPFQKGNYIPADRICTIPSLKTKDSFTITVDGPKGVEGVKAIVSLKPLNLGKWALANRFVVARTPELQKDLCKTIMDAVRQLNGDEWDVAMWTIQVTE